MDKLILAKIALLAAMAEETKIKAERAQFWDSRELKNELAKISNLAKELLESIK